MHIEQTIENYLSFVLRAESAVDDLAIFSRLLDELSLSVQLAEYEFDETDYEGPPEQNYSEIRAKVSSRFPKLGLYNSVAEVSEKVGETKVCIGDAIDDIVDITCDLLSAKWRLSQTSRNDAIFYLVTDYRSHWGRHLRELQLYLHDVWW